MNISIFIFSVLKAEVIFFDRYFKVLAGTCSVCIWMSKIHFKVHYPLQFTIFSKVTGSIPGKGTIGMCWPLWLHKKIVPASVRFELKTSWLLVLSINQLSYLADHKYVYINVRYHLFIHHNLLFFQRSQVRSQVKALLGCVRNWMWCQLCKKKIPASVRFELKTSWLLVLSTNQLSYLADHKYVDINVRYPKLFIIT